MKAPAPRNYTRQSVEVVGDPPSGGGSYVSGPLSMCLLTLMLGCGSGDAQPIEVIDSQVTVIDLTGEKRTIPAGELFNHKTGQPAVKSVLVIDKRTKQQSFVELDQLSPQTQMDSHYSLVTGD
jgi:hypothetical protein